MSCIMIRNPRNYQHLFQNIVSLKNPKISKQKQQDLYVEQWNQIKERTDMSEFVADMAMKEKRASVPGEKKQLTLGQCLFVICCCCVHIDFLVVCPFVVQPRSYKGCLIFSPHLPPLCFSRHPCYPILRCYLRILLLTSPLFCFCFLILFVFLFFIDVECGSCNEGPLSCLQLRELSQCFHQHDIRFYSLAGFGRALPLQHRLLCLEVLGKANSYHHSFSIHPW